jgi:hypothetical protein
MAMVDCSYGDGKCYVPDPALVIWDGKFSFVSHELINSFVPEFMERLSGQARSVEFAIPDEVLEALGVFDRTAAQDLRTAAQDLRDAHVEALRSTEPTDRGIFVLCQPCGHLCIVVR